MLHEQLTVRRRFLVQKNRGLAHFAVKQIWCSWRVRAGFANDFDEAVSVAYVGLIRAAQYYDPTKAKFSTLAVFVMRRMLMSEAVTRRACIRIPQEPALRGARVRVERLVEDSPRYVQPESEPTLDIKDEFEPAKKAMRRLPGRLRKVLRLYYQEDLNLEEVGKTMGLTKERVRQLRDLGLAKIREKMGVAVPVVA